MAYSDAQLAAIRHGTGPAMVIAGPGSGKTTVITRRVQYLTKEGGVDPRRILVITFTRAAAMEMKERYGELVPGGGGVTFGTFHSVFFRILRLAYRFTADNIIRQDQQKKMLKELTERYRVETEDENEFLSGLASEISQVKSERIDLANYYSACCPDETFRRIYADYDAQMRRMGLIDFDDMMVMCLELFRERKDILAAWQKRFTYILIDEFQDINRLQYEIVRMMALPENNLFIVGDDDQSIYRFRGAKPEIMLGFEKDYPGTARITLDINYRSTAEIVTASLRVIDQNENRFKKELHALDAHGKGVSVRVFEDQRGENETIAAEIRESLDSGLPASEIAVLFRTNGGPRLLLGALMACNIPFRTREQVPNLFEHWIARDILTYLALAEGSRRREDFYRIMNRPKRYISRNSMPGETVSFPELRAFYSDKEWMLDKLSNLEQDLKALSRMTPKAAVNYIRRIIGYDDFLAEFAAEHRIKKEELLEVADELREDAASYKTIDEWKEHIREYGEELRRQAARGMTVTDAVTIATMHSAKGLEFDTVYIADANEGVTPHSKSMLPEDIEEERRLFYVAMTRAKRRLFICAARERFKKPAEVSRFVYELLKPKYAKGEEGSNGTDPHLPR